MYHINKKIINWILVIAFVSWATLAIPEEKTNAASNSGYTISQEILSFLSNFPSMFDNDNDKYNKYWENVENHTAPYDYRDFYLIPYSYELIDLNQDAVPEIIIYFGVSGTDGGFDVLYQLIDGYYQEIGEFSSLYSYLDKNSNLILGDYTYEGPAYYYAVLENGKLQLEAIIDLDGYNHITNTLLDDSEWYCNVDSNCENLRIPGMPDEPLNRIYPLDTDYDVIDKTAKDLSSKHSYLESKTDLITIIGCEGRVDADVPIIIQNGRMLVPGRLIGIALRATGRWSNISETLTVTKEDREVRIYLDSTEALINGEASTMEVPMQIINNVVMVPIRFAAEALNLDVSWDSNAKTLEISKL